MVQKSKRANKLRGIKSPKSPSLFLVTHLTTFIGFVLYPPKVTLGIYKQI